MQLTNALLPLLSLSALVTAAPAADAKKSYVAEITGLPAAQYPDTLYISYGPNFFGDLALQPTKNKTAAVTWTVNAKSDLVSTTGQTISLTPPYARPQAQSIHYDAYNGTQGTYVKGKQVLNKSPDFGSWRLAESQYGASLGYQTPGYNNSNPGYPFKAYAVNFVLKH